MLKEALYSIHGNNFLYLRIKSWLRKRPWTLKIGANARLKKVRIYNYGKNNTVIFGANVRIKNCKINLHGDNNAVIIGDNTSINSNNLYQLSGGSQLTIGEDCMFSFDIHIHTTDHHSIFNAAGDLMNPPRDVTIGNRVWIGEGAALLNGSVIPDGSIVGARSVVKKIFTEKASIIAGNPAKIIKTGILWKYDIPVKKVNNIQI